MLKSIWVVTRNIVNIAFALILLFLAIKYIFGSDENTDLKKLLPKFVILMVLVNFSWLGSRVILDAANVTTNIVFSIPSGVKGVTGEVLQSKINEQKCTIVDNKAVGACRLKAAFYPFGVGETDNKVDCTDDELKTIQRENEANYPEGQNPTQANARFGKATFCWETMKIDKYNQNTASYFLSYSMAKVQNLPRANAGQDITKVAFSSLLALIIQLVYLVAFIALYVALIFRVAMLWLLVAFSPALLLLYFIKDLSIPTGGIDDKFSLQSFVNLAFVPAAVGAVWSVAFIMITTGQVLGKNYFQLKNQSGVISSHVYSAQSFFMGMDNIQEFIWLLMTIGIIWMGTFAILGKMPVVGSIFQTIESYGTGAAKWVATQPRIAPIVPIYDYNSGTVKMSNVLGKTNLDEYQKGTVGAHIQQAQLNQKLSNPGTLKIEGSLNVNSRVAYDEFKKTYGLNDRAIANNEKAIRDFINKSSIANKTEYANYIINQAKGMQNSPSVPTPQPAAPAEAAQKPAAPAKPEVSTDTTKKAEKAAGGEEAPAAES
ncbi:hypothetical protein IPJ72_02840 [Candidatus Peregrinibacteria bacterium]|nr:MAG: hypothetical protein IPJ72_02840 [Candidatus Peregrinibacteria bacterium]